jgi:hypothetical protein
VWTEWWLEVIADTMVRMTDPDAAQARVLIAAVRGRAEIDLVSVGFIRPH